MIKLKASDIVDQIEVCPYCMNTVSFSMAMRGCCGEVHFENAVLTKDDECYLESEYELEAE